jgi:spore germination cell wall hydrolase CwlJ-like protein
MKILFTAAALAGLAVFAAQAAGGQGSANPAPPAAAAPLSWGDWAQGLKAAAPRTAGSTAPVAQAPAAEVDVVDAHWMALTMWGEARGSGEEGMRAVGHVIANRRQAGGRHGAFVTDTVSEAYQFSCWNAGDPNLEAIRNVDALPAASRDYRMWLEARRIAEEILAGRSDDPTGGALFYHTNAVAPRWSQGVPPVRLIGSHLFFLTAR